jgi:hypothetical protein
MKIIYALAAFIFCSSVLSATLIHRYDFNGNLSDVFSGPDLIPVHTYNSDFVDGTWNWTATSSPGGGLLMRTSLPDPNSYSLRIVFKYQSINTVWTKILSFRGYNSGNNYFSSDSGLYFNHGNLYLYPYLNNNTIFFQPETWYDLILTRSNSGQMLVYMNALGQARQLILQYQDIYDDFVPDNYNGYNCWGLFYDDTVTTAEWTSGGSVALIEVFNAPFAVTAVQNPLLTRLGNDLNLSWDAYIGATSFNVYSAEDPANGPWELLGNTLGTNITFTAGFPRHFFQIRAVLE